LQYAQLLSAGVLLSAGLVHLLGEGAVELEESPLPDFPWPYVFCAFSFLLLFGVEKLGMLYHTSLVHEQKAMSFREKKEREQEKEKKKEQQQQQALEQDKTPTTTTTPTTTAIVNVDVELQQQQLPSSSQVDVNVQEKQQLKSPSQIDVTVPEKRHSHSHKHSHDHSHHHHHVKTSQGSVEIDEEEMHDHASEMLDSLQNSSSFVNALVLLLALSLHNLLESLSLGAAPDAETVTTLSAAICAHHYLASFSLGCAILKAKKSARQTWVIALLYGLTEPIGIAIGIGIKNVAESWVSAMLICFASGTFLFVSIVEILVPAFEKDHHHQHYVAGKTKFSFKDEAWHLVMKLGFVFYGFSLLTILAIWA